MALRHLEVAVAALNPSLADEDRRVLVVACWAMVHGLAALHNDHGLVQMDLVVGDAPSDTIALAAAVLNAFGEGMWSYARPRQRRGAKRVRSK